MVILSSVACDRVTKNYAQQSLVHAGRISLAYDIVRIEYAENQGAFLGFGASLSPPVRRILFTAGVAVIALLAALAAAWGSGRSRSEIVALALVAGGGFGNLWDRVIHGGTVVDFLNLGIGPLRTGIFNVADLSLVAGVVLLVVGARKPRSTPQA
jgi:signal peptidase II